jgi:hypothetical protein
MLFSNCCGVFFWDVSSEHAGWSYANLALVWTSSLNSAIRMEYLFYISESKRKSKCEQDHVIGRWEVLVVKRKPVIFQLVLSLKILRYVEVWVSYQDKRGFRDIWNIWKY